MKNHKLQTDYKFSAKGGSASGGKIFLILFLLATILILPVFVFADYTFLEPLPGMEKTIKTGEFSSYLSALFNYAIAIAAVLAVIMIVIGGLQYIGAAGNTSVIEDAKDRIYWAIVGLILALGSWMILYNINPELKELKIGEIETKTISTSTPATGIEKKDVSGFTLCENIGLNFEKCLPGETNCEKMGNLYCRDKTKFSSKPPEGLVTCKPETEKQCKEYGYNGCTTYIESGKYKESCI